MAEAGHVPFPPYRGKRRHVQQYVFFSVVLVKVAPDLLNVGVKLHDGGADGPED